ncbi:hypothetical protein B0J17DRAFT_678329 [Rhizoctonia solani]|nr:hypothetical protein B0J17DRAFT_678329 [Rhizoctonia solani]
MSRKVSCATCITRQKRCDGTQPVCRHCARDGIECGGYPAFKNPTRGLADSKKPRPAPSVFSVDPGVSTSNSPPIKNYPTPPWVSDMSGSEPGTPSDYYNIDGFFSPPGPHGATGSLLIGNSLPSVPPAPPIRHMLTPPDPSLGIGLGLTNNISRVFLPPKKDVRQSMTPGQASLFNALFSLARPEDDNDFLASSSFLERHPFGPVPLGPAYNLGYERDQTAILHDPADPEDSCDAREVAARLANPLALDKKVKSNALPFVLQSCKCHCSRFTAPMYG